MPRILIIDDDEMVRAAMVVMVRMGGWEAGQAADGQEGLDLARQHPPDLILCDLNMPVMDGYETLAEVRRDATLQRVPFLVVTGLTSEEHHLRALREGADAVLRKPFSRSDLLRLIETHLKRPHVDTPSGAEAEAAGAAKPERRC